jgi:type I restriction enzyme S subunit
MPIGTVCVAMYGGAGTIGKCGMIMKESATNQAVCSIVCDDSIVLPKYLLFQLLALKSYWMIYAVGTRKDPNISQDIVGKMKIIIPGTIEQKEIADYLDKKCTAIDILISKKSQFLTELENYKKSLIYEYVTGKKEVPQS